MKYNSCLLNKAAPLLFSIVVLLAGGAAAVRGQSALDGFDPNANGMVQVVVVQPDGKILIGGDFTIVQGIARNRIARLNADGTLDQLFDPNANDFVNAIAVQADGKILVGGSFNGLNSIGGTNRNRIARLDAITGQADSFNPNADNTVFSIAVQADGKILAGGNFSNIGGQARNRMARLDATTGEADSFNPSVVGLAVNTIVLQADGKILVGGTFGNIGGQPRTHIARLDATTGLADSFNPNATSSSGIPVVTAIALQADGKILAGGLFTSIGGQARNRLARLDASTGLADSFNPNADNIVRTIAVQTDGKILAGGDFTNIGGQTRNRLARLDASTGLADSLDPNVSAPANVNSIALQMDGKILFGGIFPSVAPNGGASVTRNNIARLETDGRLDRTLNLNINTGVVFATAIQMDGKILIGGSFGGLSGVSRNRIARLNPDGTADAFNPNANGIVYSIAVQTDGKILVGGEFTSIGGTNRNRIARLNPDGTLDPGFNPNANTIVRSITVQADGKILAGGEFSGANSIGGMNRNRIARLNADGTADVFNPNANNIVRSIAVLADGKILAGGDFTSIGGTNRNRIARLEATTGLADSFDPNASGLVLSIAVLADGKILVGGAFTNIAGTTRNRIARLDATTGAADSFNPSAAHIVHSIALQADGKILVGGIFTNIAGATRNGIARLDATTGAADLLFDPNASGGAFPSVNSIAVQADGKVLAGGNFTNIGGQARNLFARLINGTAALQNLAVTQMAATWTRGGSSPQLTRVTFDYSADSINYTPLGNGMAAGTNWTLTGLNLPTDQNIYIRARGFYRSGDYNGSESITESVRNVFLASSPPLLNIQRSGNANVVLSWATNFTGFTLESSTNLNPGVWSEFSPGPLVSGTNKVLTNAVSGSTRFYRLRK